jgi:integrase
MIPLYPEIPVFNNKKLFCEFINEYIERKHVTKTSRIGYRLIGTHILNFCSKYNLDEPYTDSVGIDFTETFVFYLQSDCNLMLNTVTGMLEKLRALLGKAALYGYPIDNTFREVKLKAEESYSVYLPEDEILKIYFFDDFIDKREEIVRDYFVIGCLTGLRYSDFTRIEKSHFQDYNTVIRIKTRKTGKIVHIPADKYVIEIMEKYNWELPKCFCPQAFNGILKYLCRRIGFDEEIRLERTIGLNVVSIIKQKWDMISSHTARRSFATNMYKAGFMTAEIMGITGHTSEQTFFKYIKFSNESVARSMINHPYFRRNT